MSNKVKKRRKSKCTDEEIEQILGQPEFQNLFRTAKDKYVCIYDGNIIVAHGFQSFFGSEEEAIRSLGKSLYVYRMMDAAVKLKGFEGVYYPRWTDDTTQAPPPGRMPIKDADKLVHWQEVVDLLLARGIVRIEKIP